MAATIPTFRTRLIPVTVLWAIGVYQLAGAAWLLADAVASLLNLGPTSDLASSWQPIFDLALIAWLLPTAAAAFLAGRTFWQGRWKHAALAILALFLVAYLGLIPMLLAIASYPGPK